MSTAFNALAFLLGMLVFTGIRWGIWMQKQEPGTSWRLYWKANLATNVTSGLVAIAVMVLWLAGQLDWVGSLFKAAMIEAGWNAPAEKIPIAMWSSFVVGFLTDLMARGIVRKLAVIDGNGGSK